MFGFPMKHDRRGSGALGPRLYVHPWTAASLALAVVLLLSTAAAGLARGADGYLVRLREVADVRLGAENERSLSRSNGVPGISIGVEQISKANTLEVAAAVRAELERLRPQLPPGTVLEVNMDRSAFIRESIREVLIALAIAVTQRCDASIGFHVKALIRLGATREQIMETLGVCTYMGGGPALMYAADALRAYDQFAAA